MSLKFDRSIFQFKRIFLFSLLFFSLLSSSNTVTTTSGVEYNIQQVHAESLWEYNTGLNNYNDQKITIAVIDTGLDIDHPYYIPEQSETLWKNVEEIDGLDGIDDDGNGYIDDFYGWNFIDNTNDIDDDNFVSHGTHVTGTIVGKDIGSSPNSQVMVLKAFDSEGSAEFDDVANAIYYAVDNGADIISMSLGASSTTSSLTSAINYGASHNITMVAASGNAGSNAIDYPAVYSGVYAVGSVGPDNIKSSFSNYGSGLDVMAYGEDINSTVRVGTGLSSHLYYDNQLLESYPMQFSDYTENSTTNTFSLVNAGNGSVSEFDTLGDLSDKAVLIERGAFDFLTLGQRVRDKNGSAMLVYNSEDHIFGGNLQSNISLPSVSINRSTGLFLESLIDSDNIVEIQLSITPSDFFLNTGTSMATPVISGIIAELLYAKVDPLMIDHYLKFGSSDPEGEPVTTPTLQYGYGLVNGSKLVDLLTDTIAPETSIEMMFIEIYNEQALIHMNFTENHSIDRLDYHYTFEGNQGDSIKEETHYFTNPEDRNHILALDKTQNQQSSDIDITLTDASNNSFSLSVTIDYKNEGFDEIVFESSTENTPFLLSIVLVPVILIYRKIFSPID